jgi:spore coat protein U-like protein
MKKLVVFVLAVMMMAMAGVAMAATQDVTISANIIGTCRFDSTAPVAFGQLDQTAATDETASGSVVFWCTKNAAYTLSDEANVGTADGTFSGTLVSGPDTIPYILSYNNTSGSGLGKTSLITSTINGTIANVDYVNAAAGNYTDIVTFTITP